MAMRKESLGLCAALVSAVLLTACSQEGWLNQSLQNGANSGQSFYPARTGGATGEETWQDGASAKCKQNVLEGSCF